MTQRRLPHGGTTADIHVYLDAWGELVRFAERVFPGYTADGFDPGVRLTCYESLDDEGTRAVGHVSLSVHALETLRRAVGETARVGEPGRQ